MSKKLVAAIASAILLSPGWLGMTGLTLFIAIIPLLWLSDSYDNSRKSWWRVFGWASLAFALWNISTIWWIWYATPVGPFAATLASTTLNMIAFMAYHTISKYAPKALAYTTLVALWIATEYWYTVGDFSWPWLILGNGFSHDIKLVQWYEYTGVFGGSLWILVSNIVIYEAIRRRSMQKMVTAAAVVVLPVAISLTIYYTYTPSKESCIVTITQPNIDCYDKFKSGTAQQQEENLLDLAKQAPQDADFILMPETSIPGYYNEINIESYPYISELRQTLEQTAPNAMIVAGASTTRHYSPTEKTSTARAGHGYYYDIFNSSLGISTTKEIEIYHKSRLVIGAEKTPLPWLFELLDFLVIDLGGTLGQIGQGDGGESFTNNDITVGPAICYEGLYGDLYGDFVRDGAQAMFIISNDGWWRDTPGYKHLFTISQLRAIEHRRAIARSANTGKSGFITARGDVGQTLDWEQRGAITSDVELNTKQTVYTKYGDYIGRIAQLIAMLCIIYFIAYRIKRKNNLVR